MNPVYITYKTAKVLKEFCPELPRPMDSMYMREGVEWGVKGCPTVLRMGPEYLPYPHSVPAYQLHDLLSKPFCEAMANERNKHNGHGFPATYKGIAKVIAFSFIEGQMPAVEKALLEMMEER